MNTRVASGRGITIPESDVNFLKLVKPAVFVACLLPFFMVVAGVFGNKFVDPIESLLLMTGEWGLRFLLLTLCITPLQITFKWPWIARLRGMIGLFAFFYATLHLSIWVVLDQRLNLGDVVNAVIEKPFITVGILAWLGLLPLALTSNRFSVVRLGRKWKKLHSVVYLLTLLVVVHYIWQVKASEVLEPLAYLGVLALLLLWRFARLIKRDQAS